jgi:hypothetical protein
VDGYVTGTTITKPVTIGSGGIGAGDRIEPGFELAASGRIGYLAFDCLAERTLALAQIRRLQDESQGYDERLPEIIGGLTDFLKGGGRLVGNFGAANPEAAAAAAAASLRKEGFEGTRVGVVRGDDVREAVLDQNIALPEFGCRVADVETKLVSANAYIGAEPIVELLAADCQIVLGGRIADPSVYVGPICHELGWSLDDWDRVGTATLVAHLLECGIGRGDRTDPLREPGYPMATIGGDGQIEITKLPGTDGRIDVKAVKLHLGYEVHDPAAYLTPDVSVDFTQVWARELAPDRVTIGGARGRPRPDTLKVLVGLDLGWKVVAEISYGGRGCVERARTAAQVTLHRLDPVWSEISDHRVDVHGVDALFGRSLPRHDEPPDVRLRVAFRCDSRRATEAAVQAGGQLYSAARGGGGVTVDVKPAIGVTPGFLPRSAVPLSVGVVVA